MRDIQYPFVFPGSMPHPAGAVDLAAFLQRNVDYGTGPQLSPFALPPTYDLSEIIRRNADYGRDGSSTSVFPALTDPTALAEPIDPYLPAPALSTPGQSKDGWFPSTVPSMPRQGLPPNIQENYSTFLARLPTRAEIEEVLQDFWLDFGPETGLQTVVDPKSRRLLQEYRWIEGQPYQFPDALTMMVKALQSLRWFKFSKVLPIAVPSPYDWVKNAVKQGVKFRINYRSGGTYHNVTFGGIEVHVQADSPYTEIDIINLAGTILHEFRHTIPCGGKPHDCGPWADNGLLSEGAYVLGYWWVVFCRHYTDPRLLRYATQSVLDSLAQSYWTYQLCTLWNYGNDISKVGRAPIDPDTLVQPAGESLLSLLPNMVQRPVIALNPLTTTSLAPAQIQTLLIPGTVITDASIREALMQALGLPWSLIDAMQRTV